MQWGKERSNGWLTSIGLSFFQSLLVVDPLKVFIVTALITLIMRKPEEEGEDSPVDCGDPYVNAIVNKDEEYLHQNSATLSQVDIREILHTRRAQLTKLEPIDPEELERQRIQRLQNIRVKAFLKEASIYLAFLLIVLFLAHQGRTKNSNTVHHDLKKTFLINENQIFAEVKNLFFLEKTKSLLYFVMFLKRCNQETISGIIWKLHFYLVYMHLFGTIINR